MNGSYLKIISHNLLLAVYLDFDIVSHFSGEAETFFSKIVSPFYRELKATQYITNSDWARLSYKKTVRTCYKNGPSKNHTICLC